MLRLTVIGNIGRDAELKEINGRKVVNFTIASNRKIVDTKTGEETEKTTWISCAKWYDGNINVEIHKYLLKGGKVFLEGYPEIKMYKDANNKTASSLNLNITNIELLAVNKPSDEEQDPEPETKE